MKKAYLTPATMTVKIDTIVLLNGSPTSTNLDELGVDIADPTAVGRGRFTNKLWDDDDDDWLLDE